MVTDDLIALEKMMDDEDGLSRFDRKPNNELNGSRRRMSLRNGIEALGLRKKARSSGNMETVL